MRTKRADSFQEHQTTVTECSQRTPSSQLTAQQPDLIEDEEILEAYMTNTRIKFIKDICICMFCMYMCVNVIL